MLGEQGKWLDDLVKRITGEGDLRLGARVLARRVLAQAGIRVSSGIKAVPVLELGNALGVSPLLHATISGGAGSIRREEDGFKIAINFNDPIPRQRFTVAHEIGHAVLARESQLPVYQVVGAPIERFLDEFASQILLPDELIENWFSDNLGRVSVKTIEVGAGTSGVSIPVFVKRLGEGQLLSVCKKGVVVGSLSTSRRRGVEKALRISVASFPAWGFLPFNRRFVSIGLKRGDSLFGKSLRQGSGTALEEVDEVILVKLIKDYRWVRLSTRCEYKCYVTKSRIGSFILASFDWPRPLELEE